MADPVALLDDVMTALESIGPPVILDGGADPGTPEVLVVLLVSDTARQAYGGRSTDTRLQVTAYAAGLLKALELTTQVAAALEPLGLQFIQSRPAPDPDSIGQLAEFTT